MEMILNLTESDLTKSGKKCLKNFPDEQLNWTHFENISLKHVQLATKIVFENDEKIIVLKDINGDIGTFPKYIFHHQV